MEPDKAAGSVDFTLVGRPIVPRDIVKVMATCVQIRPRDEATMTFLNPRAPRRPVNDFNRDTFITLRVNFVDIKPALE